MRFALASAFLTVMLVEGVAMADAYGSPPWRGVIVFLCAISIAAMVWALWMRRG